MEYAAHHRFADMSARKIRPFAALIRGRRADEALYLAPAQDILWVIRATGPRIAHLMIVGHNPGITEVANLLAPTARIELATAAICSLTFDTRRWSEDSSSHRGTHDGCSVSVVPAGTTQSATCRANTASRQASHPRSNWPR